MNAATVYLALGSNQGDRRQNLLDALDELAAQVQIERLSSIYETEPAYVTDQTNFFNMVLRGRTSLQPRALLRFAKSVEQRVGRKEGVRFGPRPIDVDILLYDDLQLDEADLIIPHPRLAERAFVLTPLAEIAPELVLPGRQETVRVLAQQDGSKGEIIRVVVDDEVLPKKERAPQ